MLHIALIVMRNEEGKYLFQFRDSNAPTNKLKITFFGGSMDAGEQPVDAALRELKEELEWDVRPEDVRLVVEKPWFQEELEEDETMYVFEVTKPVSWDDIRLREGAGAVFLTIDELMSLEIATPFVKEVMRECY